MLVTLTATRPAGASWPASDLGFLLAKNPARVQTFQHAFGRSRVFYPTARDEVCTAALMLEIDPVSLVRSRNLDSADFSLSQYVNDRPYAAGSLLAAALGQVFRSAIRGASKERPELAATPLPLEVRLPATPASASLIERMFAPLGWTVDARPIPLDPAFPDWGESRYCDVTLTGTKTVSETLSQLYVLLPVLDGSKHYWIAPDEVDKLLRGGQSWLPGHPDRNLIARRYLARRAGLVRSALARLAEIDDAAEAELDNAIDPERLEEADLLDAEAEAATAAAAALATAAVTAAVAVAAAAPQESAAADAPAGPADAAQAASAAPAEKSAASTDAEEVVESDDPSTHKNLATQRREAVHAALKDVGGARVLDLGCGGGALLSSLLRDRYFTEIVGVDVSVSALKYASRKLRLDRQPERVARRLTLKQGALTYTDPSLKGYDAAALMEVIEHVDPPRLAALEHAVFASAKPGAVVVTTPNAEYNVRYETLEAGRMRHRDHRFEWTREQFSAWAERVGAEHGYSVEYRPVGEVDPELGPSTQMAVFRLAPEDSDALAGAAVPAAQEAAS
jgi:2-polyprenyl-3-methyl-5-hydroxy-6-metoxy-1,4-benzoquinol methylase